MRHRSFLPHVSVVLLTCFSSTTQAQSNVTLYGVLDVGLTYISNVSGKKVFEETSDEATSSRVGLKGVEDLGGGLSALFALEMRPSINSGTIYSPFWNRASYVGLGSTTYGTLTLGRQFDFMKYSLPIDSGGLIQGSTVEGYDGFASNKPGAPPAVDNHASVAIYDNSAKWDVTVGPWSGGLMYGLGRDNNHDSMYAAYLKYVKNGLQLGAGWTRDNFTTSVFANEVYSIRANYTIGSFLILANYSQGKEIAFPGSKATARPFELAVIYTLRPDILVGGGMGWARDTNRAGANATITQPFIGGRYLLSKRTYLFASASRNHSSDPAVIPSTVGVPGGAASSSTTASQLAVHMGIVTTF
ncbi:porin [Caballeronia sordidicola]|uniref:Outer membrane protein (Porin) n=1 Tax=Caballeronia sordidicola TaxID=196367 RepID=A0A242MZ91_CABSO|nr:porin [Caballeronia sordidicola]OTP76206.1 Outer membrane protein (porin) [Caballeronia sordidicola]